MLKGNFLNLGEKAEPGVPAALHPQPKDAPLNRLAVAQWLFDANNPLTARVAVNRYWAALFGVGLVETEEDFGTQGEMPSHPELLDWLATEYMRLGWDTKAFLKLLVTSATYRQSSKVTTQALAKDPRNRLLSRGPRFRLEAEMVRDQALALSGLLSRKLHGPRCIHRNRQACGKRRSTVNAPGRRVVAKIAIAGGCTHSGGAPCRIRRWPPSTPPAAKPARCAASAPTRRYRLSSH